jgi:hypothetical protein
MWYTSPLTFITICEFGDPLGDEGITSNAYFPKRFAQVIFLVLEALWVGDSFDKPN